MEVSLEALQQLIYDPGEEIEESRVCDITGGILDMLKVA
jgi:hypothetical protein